MSPCITQQTTFSYDSRVIEAYMEMRLRRLDAGGQRCESFWMVTDPAGAVLGYVDLFGNTVRHFDTIAHHDWLVRAPVVQDASSGYQRPLDCTGRLASPLTPLGHWKKGTSLGTVSTFLIRRTTNRVL
jgi:hypothetical protein